MIKRAEIQRPYPLGHGGPPFFVVAILMSKGDMEGIENVTIAGLAWPIRGIKRRKPLQNQKHKSTNTRILESDISVSTDRQICPKGHCFGITRLCRVMPNSDTRDISVCPFLIPLLKRSKNQYICCLCANSIPHC